MDRETIMADRDIRDTEWNGSLSRRQLLAGAGTAGTVLLAGCEGAPTGNGDDADGNGGGGNSGGGNGGGGGRASVGDVRTGEYVSITFEYLRPVEELWEYSLFGNLLFREPDSLVPRAQLDEDSAYYAMGVAATNTSQTMVYPFLSTTLEGLFASDSEDGIGRSQKLSLEPDRTGRALVPGETVRGELILALDDDPGEYVLSFYLNDPETGDEESLSFDLGGGSETTASFDQNVSVTRTGEAVSIGPFETVINDLEYVDTVEGADRPDMYDSREGARYLLVDLTATRTSDDLFDGYSLGLASDDGYDFMYLGFYEDALDAERGTPWDLDVGETMENMILALLVEDDFEPDYLTITSNNFLDDGLEALETIPKAFWAIP